MMTTSPRGSKNSQKAVTPTKNVVDRGEVENRKKNGNVENCYHEKRSYEFLMC